MAYENFMSKMEDVVRLAYQLKYVLGVMISINQSGLYKNVLEGKYNLKGYDRGIDFTILYSDKEFLRVSVGEVGAYASSYEDKVFVLNELKNAIGNIVRDGVSLGEPTLFYNIKDEEYKIPHLEYIYADKETAIGMFQDKTIFDDGTIPEDLIIFDSVKKGKEFKIVKDYCYVTPDAKNKYSIDICATLKNKSDIEINELRNAMFENLNNLFDGDSLMTYYNDIPYVVSYIKNALSLSEEQMLDITVVKDKKEIKSIKYIEGTLVSYDCRHEFGECIMYINYSEKDGIKFETKCDTSAYDLIEDVVRNELQNINALKDVNNQYNVKSNDNLLKLVRRIGNK